MIRRLVLVLAAVVAAVIPVATPAAAGPKIFPNVIDLPGGFFTGRWTTLCDDEAEDTLQ